MEQNSHYKNLLGGIAEGTMKGVYLPSYLLKKVGILDYSTSEAFDKGDMKFPIGNRESYLYQIGAGVGDVIGLGILVVDRSILAPLVPIFFDGLISASNKRLDKLEGKLV